METTQSSGILLPKEVIRNLIASEEFQNTGDILGCLKGMFKQVLQEVLEVEMDALLGHEKHERAEATEGRNYRNGYNRKTVKSQLGEVDISIPRVPNPPACGRQSHRIRAANPMTFGQRIR